MCRFMHEHCPSAAAGAGSVAHNVKLAWNCASLARSDTFRRLAGHSVSVPVKPRPPATLQAACAGATFASAPSRP